MQACKLVSDKETAVEEIKHRLVCVTDDIWQDVEKLLCDADPLLVDKHFEHDVEGDGTLFVESDVNGRCLSAR